MIQKSHDDRMLWAQFDALEMGTGWEDTDILKPQIMIESVYGDSHPGSYHLNQMVEQAVYGVYQCGGKPAKYYATDICDGCAQGHDGMNVVLASREAIANMVEVHASGRALGRHDPLVELRQVHPGAPQGRSRMDIPAIFMPGRLHAPGPNMTTSLVAGRHFPAPEAQGCHHSAGGPRLQADRLSVRRRVHLPRNGFHHAVHG